MAAYLKYDLDDLISSSSYNAAVSLSAICSIFFSKISLYTIGETNGLNPNEVAK
jgi:hypothetical protein